MIRQFVFLLFSCVIALQVLRTAKLKKRLATSTPAYQTSFLTSNVDLNSFNHHKITAILFVPNKQDPVVQAESTEDMNGDNQGHVFTCPVDGCNCSVVNNLNHMTSLADDLTSDGDIHPKPGPRKRTSSVPGRKTNHARFLEKRRKTESVHVRDQEPPPESIGSVFDRQPCQFCQARLFPGENTSFCCNSGKLQGLIKFLPSVPNEIKEVFENRNFLENIRTYNNVFALASLGCSEVREPGYSPTVKIHGKLHHFIGSLLPSRGVSAKYAQLYFYDVEHELQNRLHLSSILEEDIVNKLQNFLHRNNPFVMTLKNAAETAGESQDLSIILKSDGSKVTSMPTSDQIAGILYNHDGNHLDVIFQKRDGRITRINELHRSYDPLHYVLLFPHGTDGYHLKLVDSKLKSISALSFYKFMLQVRDNTERQNLLLHSRRLTQQYAIDQFVKIETSRLNWHRHNQKTLRAEKYQGLIDSVNAGDTFAPGKRIILPPSFYGSPRWYIEAFNDAMTIVRKYGKPDLFITLTCNPKWPEIQDSLLPGEKAEDRPDLCVRVFHQKMKHLIKRVTKDNILGRVIAFTCMKEDQKRGLPHCHMLLIMHKDDKLRRPEDVDRIISAEIPDKEKFPILHGIITDNMVHGPCGLINKERPCMNGSKDKEHCCKGFPKPFNNTGTTLSDNTYPNYLRRDTLHGGHVVYRSVRGKSYTIDNRWIVPYSPKLSYAFNAHVNVEVVVTVKAVKYLYKYITKGSDQILFAVQDGVLDEIKNFETGRFVSASEAMWRIYSFEIMNRFPSVMKLALHLSNEQTVLFQTEDLHDAIDEGPPSTTLTAFFELNKTDEEARGILYPDICQYYRFISGKWQKRKLNTSRRAGANHPPSDTLGRIPIITLNPKQSELFYLRMLLHHVPGPQDFCDLKKVDGVEMESFQAACIRRGLLSDDSEVEQIITEMAETKFGSELRELFSTVLAHTAPIDPVALWERHKDSLTEDIAYKNGRNNVPDLSDYAEALLEIQEFLTSQELDLQKHFGIVIPNVPNNYATGSHDPTIYDVDFLAQHATECYGLMTPEQKNVFDMIIDSVTEKKGTCFALNAPGGTGKTFVLTAVLAQVRSRKQVAFATAISGIAATLLPQGNTAHSKLKVPIDIDPFSTCNIGLNSALAHQIRQAEILIIDEITMANRHLFEAVDRTIKDIRKSEKLFGGLTTVLSGDWRQILPIIKHGSKAEIIAACLKQSYIWRQVTSLHLTKNMRLSEDGEVLDDEFSKFLLSIGDGSAAPANPENPEYLDIPEEFLLENNTLKELCDFAYHDLDSNFDSTKWLCKRCILGVTNEAAETVNKEMHKRFPGDDNIRKSADVILDADLARYYPTEFLNSLTPSGMPPHVLNLKVGTPIMLLRNLDAVRGHCNGTRYVIKQCHRHVIEATVASGLAIGSQKLIPRIPITLNDKSLPFGFKRTQFPVKTCFGMTINKSQGQSLDTVGIYLDQDIFAHGQLYVAMSRVKNKKNLRIVYPKENNKTMRNVVYKEVL